MNARSVLHVNSAEELAGYQEAVAEILRRIQSDYSLTLLEIADRIDVSLGTISAAANKKSALSATYLKRLARHFGAHMLDPFVADLGARVAAVQATDRRDVLPFLSRSALRIAEARDPDSPGGERETHCERFGYLPGLREMVREAQALIAEIEAEERALKGRAA